MKKLKNTYRSCWLFRRDGRDLRGWKRFVFLLWSWLIPLLCAVGTGVLSLLLAFGRYSWGVFTGYFTHPLIALLNILPVLLLYLLLYCALDRAWLAHLVGSIIVLGLSAANYFMLLFRDDVLLFIDILDAPTALGVVGNYHMSIDDRLLACILYLAVTTVLLALFVRGGQRWYTRSVLSLVLLLCCVFPLRKTYTRWETYEQKTQNFDCVNRWSSTQAYLSRGFLYPFLYSVSSAFPVEPDGYSDAYAEALLAPYTDGAIPEGEKVNIVSFMLEAFSDMSDWEIPGLSDEVYAAYHALEAESLHGTLVDNIFAGGTVDTERCFLTGSGIVDNYRKNANSYVWDLRAQGYTTGGGHPCYDWFYNRRNVNAYLGFQSYDFLQDHYGALVNGGIALDNVFIPEVTRLLLEAFEGDPSFTFNLTYQGHGPYETETLYFGEWVENVGYSDAAFGIMNNYFGSVKDTAERLNTMVDALRACDEPVVLVVFGDHKPWFGDANAVYDELGVNLDTGTEEGFYNYYSTSYLIWANDAAKETLGKDFCGEGPTISPSFLMNLLYRECGWTGSAFMQYADTVMAELPVVTSNGFYVTADGTFTTDLTPEQQQLVNDFRIADYWYRHHYQAR